MGKNKKGAGSQNPPFGSLSNRHASKCNDLWWCLGLCLSLYSLAQLAGLPRFLQKFKAKSERICTLIAPEQMLIMCKVLSSSNNYSLLT